MSDVHATPAAVAVPATETVPTPATETTPAIVAATEAPAAAKADEPVVAPAAATPAPAAVTAAEAAPAAAAAETAEKPVEPVNEGLLGYKAPGLLKQFTFAKKDFWFSDEPVSPAGLELYLRGEKADISHPVVAWASQTGKGLLFFVKKGETDKTRPAGVLPLYEVTDLKKSGTHEFTFRLHNQNHTFKASDEAERDGWYHSIEKSVEHGKASLESVRESEAYKSELAKLSSAGTTLTPGGAVVPVSASYPRKSAEFDTAVANAKPAGSDDEDELKKNNNKSRSNSRGVLARLRGKKEELEAKVEEKKEEHEAKKEEKEAAKAVETTPAAQTTTATDGPSEIETTAVAGFVGIEEKPKPTKRGSIFGSLKAGFKSPIKEKEFKDAELKQEGAVSDVAPQLPETTAAPVIAEPAPVAAAPESKLETETAKESEVLTPTREKKNFLSGFLPKRDRSVSPSAPVKDVAAIEPAVETPAVAAAPGVESPVVAADEAKVEETTPAAKRQSVFGGLGRRASKMMSRVQSSKKDELPTESKTEEATETTHPITEDLAAHEATEPVAVESTPTAVAPASGTVVAASA
ncbi:hypothetical protein AMS68_007128 [Peltaster fructicola]|uniref:PH domain-containing protein n=1 Tax=Peltaster fructicola TaxID=286661 RepID=A0A6H0Y3W5_9PEZI|nr:hypothetical protein AMS68_007128 [Peltaster fructicola]